MMWSLLFILLLVRFGLMSGHLFLEIVAGSAGQLSHSLLSIFDFYLFPFFESRSGLVSFQTDHSIWCVLVAFLTRPKPHFKELPGQLR